MEPYLILTNKLERGRFYVVIEHCGEYLNSVPLWHVLIVRQMGSIIIGARLGEPDLLLMEEVTEPSTVKMVNLIISEPKRAFSLCL